MNFRDSEFALGLLMEAGFRRAESIEDADIILFNTCSVRQHAEDRASANIWNLAKLKKQRPGLLIGVIGCMAQAKKTKIFEDIPLVDFTCGPDNETELPRLIKGLLKDRANIAVLNNIGKPRKEAFPSYRDNDIKAFVSISHGCSNFCSYCIVPYVRGGERPRNLKDIMREVKDLGARGFKEITLLGQNVNSYKGNGERGTGYGFAKLLEDINKVKGDFRIRFMTSHPKDASPALFKAMRDLPKVCEHLHLPMQSGSDRVLKLMNRGYKTKDYLRLVESYRKFLPQGCLTTDIIVGFPSESDKDFRDTLRMMEGIGFDAGFMFKYSPRPFTKAESFKDDIPEEVKTGRNLALLEAQGRISKKKNGLLIGTSQEVLLEGVIPSKMKGMSGRTRTNKTALVECEEDLSGRFVNVKIEAATCHTLRGRVV